MLEKTGRFGGEAPEGDRVTYWRKRCRLLRVPPDPLVAPPFFFPRADALPKGSSFTIFGNAFAAARNFGHASDFGPAINAAYKSANVDDVPSFTMAGAIVFSGVETGFTIWAVLHTVVPSRLPFLLGSTPFWASFVGHVGFGVVLGLLLLAGPFHAAATRNRALHPTHATAE